jgi:hypothetical protein
MTSQTCMYVGVPVGDTTYSCTHHRLRQYTSFACFHSHRSNRFLKKKETAALSARAVTALSATNRTFSYTTLGRTGLQLLTTAVWWLSGGGSHLLAEGTRISKPAVGHRILHVRVAAMFWNSDQGVRAPGGMYTFCVNLTRVGHFSPHMQ